MLRNMLGQILDPFIKYVETPILIGFQQQNIIFAAHPPKNRNTICERACAN